MLTTQVPERQSRPDLGIQEEDVVRSLQQIQDKISDQDKVKIVNDMIEQGLTHVGEQQNPIYRDPKTNKQEEGFQYVNSKTGKTVIAPLELTLSMDGRADYFKVDFYNKIF